MRHDGEDMDVLPATTPGFDRFSVNGMGRSLGFRRSLRWSGPEYSGYCVSKDTHRRQIVGGRNLMVATMLKQTHPRSGGLAVKMLGSLLVLIALGAVMYLVLPNRTTDGPQTPQNASIDDKARRCEDQLADVFEALSPGRLGISSDRAQVIERLNHWLQECGSVSTESLPSSDAELINSLLTGDTLARAVSDRFLAEDATHIRMSLLSRDIATSLVEGKISNVDRAVSLFDFVSRNVMLIDDEIRQQIPMTPYECLVFGLGTAEDRAWVFADLLRQIRSDAIILTPANEEKAEHWLVGVIDPEQGVLLFDARLGLPIPAEGAPIDTPYPKQPATLKQVLSSDAAFRQLDVPDSPYPLSSADLADCKVSVIGSTSSWAPRMARLQFLLPEGTSVELYDGLGENQLRAPGLIERIVAAGQDGLWKRDQVVLWSYPEKAEREFEVTRGEGAADSMLASYQTIFRGPYVPRPLDREGKEFQQVPVDKSLHFVRVEQLRGKYSNAIRDYVPIRTVEKQYPSPANQMAAEFGTLWTGVCQYQTQKIRVALGTFDRYVVNQARSPGMSRTAIEYLADCMLTQKNYVSAIMILMRAPQGFAPRRDQYLIQRWMKLGDLDQETLEKKIKEIEAEAAAAMKGASTTPAEAAPESQPAPAEKMNEMKKPDAAPEGAASSDSAGKSETGEDAAKADSDRFVVPPPDAPDPPPAEPVPPQ